jgi:hypothetical protein
MGMTKTLSYEKIKLSHKFYTKTFSIQRLFEKAKKTKTNRKDDNRCSQLLTWFIPLLFIVNIFPIHLKATRFDYKLDLGETITMFYHVQL